jgi:phosphohistidine swiveling domain-containing protein
MMSSQSEESRGQEILTLVAAARAGPERVGSKAFNLAQLAAAGLPVPPGFVVPEEAFLDWDAAAPAVTQAATELGAPAVAVRSSGVAEDLPGASYAGMYETVLNVEPASVAAAVMHVRASVSETRLAAYRKGSAGRMAVLVQAMVQAEAAGVAFTADPVTGARDEVVITAVRGLGDRLVEGEAVGDLWVVRDGRALCRRRGEDALDAALAQQIAELARSVESHFGVPQDMEWAVAGGRVFVLQARPMTALPEPVSWAPPGRGWWLRNFRLGEWLPDPVTPLFASWLLPALERGVARAMTAEQGMAIRPNGAVIRGWYYTTPNPHFDGAIVPQLLRHPGVLARAPRVVMLLTHPERMPRELARMTRHWREEVLPRYRRTVAVAEAAAGTAAPGELTRLIDQVGEVAGEYSWSVATLAGSQWKIEAALAKFCRRHLAGFGQSPQLLVSGLPGTEPQWAAHAVYSIDWFWPTAGEEDVAQPEMSTAHRHRELAGRREEAEAECRAALAGQPRLRRRFERLLAVAQDYAVVREQQTREFSLGWPVLRRCVLRVGQELADRGAVGQADDVFFLTRSEVEAALKTDPVVAAEQDIPQRRQTWEQQRRLTPPLTLGKAPAPARKIYATAVEASRTQPAVPVEGGLVGEPASPGRATGPVHVILDPADFGSFQTGQVLVARTTTPAWTPLFAKASAVVTDGGTLAAHASLIAREYGIPAVVATTDATTRLRDGQLVTVDGGAGLVSPQA